MVFAELKPQIEQLSRRERVKAAAYLKHLLRVGTAENRRELSRAHAEIEAGRKLTLAEAKRRLH